jgi:hypothetical protein
MSGYPGSFLDPQTVFLLETRMPFISSHDEEMIKDMMQQRQIFPNLPTEEARAAILEKILQIDGRILSLHTFTRDFFFFEACALALKQVLPISKRSMADEFMRSFSGVNQTPGTCKFQIGDSEFTNRAGSYDLCPKLGYQQLFLAVMRDFPTLTKLSPYKNRGNDTTGQWGFVSERVFKLAEIATFLGFSNSKISQIQSTDAGAPYKAATTEYLAQLQPSDRYMVDSQRRAEIAQNVANELSHISVNRPSHERAEFTTNLHEAPKKSRCSRPSIQDYHKYRAYLFLEILMDNNVVRRAHPNSLAIQKDIFVSFFGDLNGNQGLSTEDTFHDNSSSTHNSAHLSENNSPYESASPRYSPSSISSPRQSPIAQGDDSLSQQSLPIHEVTPLQEAEEALFHEPTDQSWVSGSVTTDSHEDSGSNFLDPDYTFADEREVPLETLDPHLRPSSFLHTLIHDEQNIVFYLWNDRKFVRLSADEPELPNFRATANWLADQNNMFLCCVSSRWRVISLRNLYATARQARLILVRQKLCRTGTEPGTMLYLRDGLYRYLDRDYDSATHNHER